MKLMAYTAEEKLCVYKTLEEYISRTSELRGVEQSLFISFQKPHKRVTKSTISRWIKDVMARAGIDTAKYQAHSVRPASASKAMSKEVPIDIIMSTAGWTRESTFAKFYNKEIKRNQYASVILDDC